MHHHSAADADGDDQDAGFKMTSYRWYVLILLTVIYTIYNVDRNLVVILAEPIRDEFNLSDSQLGLLTGTSFAIAFAVAGIPLGFVVDKTNRVKLIAGLLATWSAVTVMCAFVRTFPTLLLTRIGVGAAESGASPTCLSLISDYFPKTMRGRALGIFYLSTPIGLGLGFAIGGVAAQHLGWRDVFIWAGAPGIVLAALIWFTLREPIRGAFEKKKESEAKGVSSFSTAFAAIQQRSSLFYLIAASVTVICAQTGISAFMPSLYVRLHGLDIGQTGLMVALVKGVGGALGMPAGGVLSDYLSKRSISLSPLLVCGAVLLAAPLAAIGIFATTLWVSVTAFFFYAVVVHTYLGPTLATYLTLAPTHLRGAMSGFIIVAMNLIGFGTGALLTGMLSDFFLAHGFEQPLRFAMLAMIPFFLISAAFYYVASRTAQRDSERSWTGSLATAAS